MSTSAQQRKVIPGLPKPPARRWLMDRIRGTSKYGDREKPCGPCCLVPPIVGWCPGLWEENVFCKAFGRVGAYGSEGGRCFCMHFGFFANVIACMFMAYSCLAITEDYFLLTKSSFGSIVMKEKNGLFEEEINLDIGLRAVALNNPFTGIEETVIGFDQFCKVSESGLQRYVTPGNCSSCDDNSLNFVISAILCVISFAPTFFTDVNRMFSGYDANCSKCFGVFFSLLTVGLALNVMFTWKFLCGDTFFKNEIYLDEDGNRLSFPDDPAVAFTIDYEYTWGWGMLAMIVGASFKFVEVVAHFCVPTPTVTRDWKEQEIYEVIKVEEITEV